jgi:hypothetical protein
MNHVSLNALSRHLHHTDIEFIGTGQTVTVDGPANNTLYVLDATSGPMFAATAHLVVNDARTFHGSISLGSFSDVSLQHVWASSYTFDATHDLLKLYQGDKVVDTLSLHVPGATGTNSVLFMQSPPATAVASSGGDGWVYFGTGYHGLSYGISPHAAPNTGLI